MVLTGTNAGVDDEDRFAFRSPWMAWRGAPVHDAHAHHPGRGGSLHPPRAGEELFRAIAASGSEVELVTYPREGHVPVERGHALDAITRTQAWFDRHSVRSYG
ncbi:MAG: alpha/beta hydrolase family protein [Actinomycetota bacterium]